MSKVPGPKSNTESLTHPAIRHYAALLATNIVSANDTGVSDCTSEPGCGFDLRRWTLELGLSHFTIVPVRPQVVLVKKSPRGLDVVGRLSS